MKLHFEEKIYVLWAKHEKEEETHCLSIPGRISLSLASPPFFLICVPGMVEGRKWKKGWPKDGIDMFIDTQLTSQCVVVVVPSK